VTAQVLDGRVAAREIYQQIASSVAAHIERGGSRPRLATVVVGDDPASAQYVRMKQANAKQVGIDSDDHRLPAATTTAQLLELVESLNADETVSGILVQQPAPRHIDMTRVIEALDPAKDVDGAHPMNAGRVALGFAGAIEPCTPSGIIVLLERAGIRIEGANAVVVGRSNLVGKPTALLLLHRHATVTVCHTRTVDLASHSRTADILVAAAGKANLITKEMVKPGAAVIDVGTNWVEGRQVGDLAPGVGEVAGWLTPNPGGVGPMTRAMLIKNTFQAEVRRRPNG
jgi:methylenetetrahydrofolate dehydrogenase (NADP+)/methenyltetrahydrofolate cyclohydrolase